MSLPPGPRLPRILQGAAFVRDPIGFLERCRDRYGDYFTAGFPLVGTVVYVADPADVKQIFTGKPDLFHAGVANAQMFEPVVGKHSLLTLDESDHLRQRKLLLPPFHGDRMRAYEGIFADVAAREVERWPLGRPFPIIDGMRRITMEVILRAVLGLAEPQRLRAFTDAVLRFDSIAGMLLPLKALHRDLGRLSPWRRFLDARAALDRLIYDEVASRRAAGASDRDDVLSLMLEARHDDGTPMSDQEMRDEIVTLIAAGFGTSSTSLAWVFERVLRTPPVLERLLGDPSDAAYVDAVVNETMRVRSPVTDSTRVLTRETEIGGYTLPAGTQVVVPLPLLHLRSDSWPDPYSFRPERFLEKSAEPYTFIPFGGGIRRCMGASFAQLEMNVVVRTVLERATLRAASPKPESQRLHHVAVVPARGARVVMTARRSEPVSPRGRGEAVPSS
jgi:cytochrome P450 family 135